MKKTDIIGKKIRIIEMKDEPTYTGRIGIAAGSLGTSHIQMGNGAIRP